MMYLHATAVSLWPLAMPCWEKLLEEFCNEHLFAFELVCCDFSLLAAGSAILSEDLDKEAWAHPYDTNNTCHPGKFLCDDTPSLFSQAQILRARWSRNMSARRRQSLNWFLIRKRSFLRKLGMTLVETTWSQLVGSHRLLIQLSSFWCDAVLPFVSFGDAPFWGPIAGLASSWYLQT